MRVARHLFTSAVKLNAWPTQILNPSLFLRYSLTEATEKPNVVSQSQRNHGRICDNSVVSWTSEISKNAKMGLYDTALGYFIEMQRFGVEPNERTFSIVLGVCSRLQRIDIGRSLHCLVLRKGLSTQQFVISGLTSLYSKCTFMEEARKLFDEMPQRDAVSWNTMIAAYSQKDLYSEAFDVFIELLGDGTEWKLLMNDYTFASLFKACAGLGCVKIGKSLHTCAVKMDFDSDVFVAGSMIDMYSKCGSLDMARGVFDQMGKRDIVVWNSMITGYAQNEYGWEVIELFELLQLEEFSPNETTLSCALKASGLLEASNLGRCFHGKSLISGSLSDVFVGTAVVDMYAKCVDMEHAERAFKDMITRNLVCFNALITGYSIGGRYADALKIYINLLSENLRPDSFTFAGMLSSCSLSGALKEGAQIHACVLKVGLEWGIIVGNSLVNLYAKCGLMESAAKSFISIVAPSAVSWAGIISGFAQNGENEKALEYFCKLHKFLEKPDEFSFTSVLKALASSAALEQGRHVHALGIKMGLDVTVFVGSALIDMYEKCGMVEDSFELFSKMPDKNVVSWNAMIIACAQNGYSNKSLLLFEEMVSSGVIPTGITFTGILLACSRAGLVEVGKQYYKYMVSDYKITPSVEHCTCMVDLLGRSGHLNDAETFLLNSPFSSEPGLWRSLLTACGFLKNMDVGIRAAEHCLRLEPHDPVAYVTLSNIYASKELWHEVTRIRDLMKKMDVEKEKGCSWIEVRNTEHTFVADGKLLSENAQ